MARCGIDQDCSLQHLLSLKLWGTLFSGFPGDVQAAVCFSKQHQPQLSATGGLCVAFVCRWRAPGYGLLWPGLLWPRPSLAMTYFGHDLLSPRPTFATTYFRHDQADCCTAKQTLATTFNLANLGRFWSGQADFGQLCPPTLAWPIWAMLGRFWCARPTLANGPPPSPPWTALRRTALRRTAQHFALFFSSPAHNFHSFFNLLRVFPCLFFSLQVSSRVFLVFWWCFGRSGPQMCLFSPSGCRVIPRRPSTPDTVDQGRGERLGAKNADLRSRNGASLARAWAISKKLGLLHRPPVSSATTARQDRSAATSSVNLASLSRHSGNIWARTRSTTASQRASER